MNRRDFLKLFVGVPAAVAAGKALPKKTLTQESVIASGYISTGETFSDAYSITVSNANEQITRFVWGPDGIYPISEDVHV
jgi:hypothetical protein